MLQSYTVILFKYLEITYNSSILFHSVSHKAERIKPDYIISWDSHVSEPKPIQDQKTAVQFSNF